MNKELFVSSTPHETRVGLVEDDQLAEIYLERENEYTLAGSIYKGRVTRVLPGMQSAFVDIGLERDAFLYVSDFMELEDTEEVEDMPASRPAPPPRLDTFPASDAAGNTAPDEAPAVVEPGQAAEFHPSRGDSEAGESRRWRGRRRRGRRGERDHGDRDHNDRERTETKFMRPAPEPRAERSDYGPPPGYQPIVLPGESISKYQRKAQEQLTASLHRSEPETGAPPIAETFPDDEPAFAGTKSTPRAQEVAAATLPPPADLPSVSGPADEPWEEEQHSVPAVFGETATEPDHRESLSTFPGHSDQPQSATAAGTLAEEEIEEEEADLAHYVDALEEDNIFDEMEEETTAAGELHGEAPATEIAASGEPPSETVVPFSAEPISEGQAGAAEGEEVEDEAEEEAELEEAQAEAEALLDAEARGNGTVDARVEVRGPSGTAGLTQRAPRRAGFDRNRGQRGRRGGRRFRRRDNQQVPQISDLLKEGQEILVQIAKEPIGKKGARITSHIALPGRFLVYMPTVNHTGVSRKIASEEERQRLKRIILSERGENGHGGFIVRTAAQNASEEELRADIRFLKGLWNEIKGRAEAGKAPALIYHDLNVVERVLRDQVTSDFSVIWVDNEQEYERILRFANRFQPALVRRVKLYSKEVPLYEQFGLNDEINKALKSKVWLKSGGYIVINQTEALVAIDVNTGKYVGKTTRLEDTIVKTNVDAIKEIVRQIRLRDLGGIIIIDFIDMDERRNRQKVMQALEEALRGDRAPSKVLQFNDFGLVAITRKRVKQSLERTIGTPCPYCASTGFVKSVTTVCNEIYVEMRKIAQHLEHTDVMLRVNPEVAKALKANNGRLLTEMEELTKKTVIVKSDPALHQEQFDIN